MDETFQDKCVLVTGAGAGIGFALCRDFARRGAFVALNDIDAVLAGEAAARLNQGLGESRVTSYGADVADVDAVRRMMADFTARFGRLDVVVANAGITSYGPFLEYSEEEFNRVTSVNLRGSYFTAQAAARAMISLGTRNGRILLMSSVTGLRALVNLSAYGITKAGISHMARVIALELASHGITVNAICPGATATERTLSDDPLYEQNWAGVTPTGRAGSIEDVAAAALFLASPQASHITGQTLIVDGGWSLRSPLAADYPEMPLGREGQEK